MVNKIDELKTIVVNNKPLIIAVTEINPKNSRFSLQNVEINLPGFNLYTSNNQEENERGCAIYIHDSLVSNACNREFRKEEGVWCEIDLLNSDKLLIGCVYRSPNIDDQGNQAFISMLNTMCERNNYSHYLILGDFNLPNIDWSTWSAPSDNINEHHNMFIECLRDNYLFQHVERPTRGRVNQKSNILDLILTNEEGMIEDLEHWSPLGKSDHCILKFKFNCYIDRPESTTKRYNYNKGDFEKIIQDLELDWELELSKFKTIDEKWNFFKNKVKESVDENIPKKRVGKNHKFKPGLMNERLLAKIRKKHRAWQRYMETKEGEKYQEYCKIRNKVKSLVRKAKIDYEKIISENAKSNPKKFWEYTKSKTKVREGIPNLDIPESEDKENPDTTRNDSQKADVLLNFFNSVFTRENTENVPLVDSFTDQILEDLEIDENMVEAKLKGLNVNKSPGPDGIHPRVLFEIRKAITTPLTILYKFSLQNSQVPQDWRDAHISAIFKKGNKRKPNNYRPVSLTSIACKLMESIVRDHIIDHMKRNNLFSKYQFGFMKGRSTTYQLLKALDDWTEILDNSGKIDLIYFDFMKAFDTVPHIRLLRKLNAHGIRNGTAKWIQAFLTKRRQKVVVNGSESEWGEVTSGIPQGSILGPLLFILYINDLPEVVKSSVLLFADDTKIYRKIEDEEDHEALQEDIDQMQDWSNKWLLRFHPDKCKYMRIGREDDNIVNYTLNGHILKSTHEEKDLGIIIDDKLKFDSHISAKVNTANKIMGIIRRSFIHLDETIFTRLFKALVRPHLEYGNSVWQASTKKSKILIENVQRRATKRLSCCRELGYDERLRKLELPCLRYRKLRGDMIECYKISEGHYDVEIDPPLKFIKDTDIRSSRGNSKKLYKEKCKKELRRNYFRNRIVNLWNALPNSVVESPTLNTFKNRLDKFWSQSNIKYDFEKCLDFEKYYLNPNITGTGIKLTREDKDLETQDP